MNRRVKMSFLVVALALLVGIVASCASNGGNLPPLDQTLTPMSASVRGTLTARAGSVNSNDDLSIAIAKATSEAGNIYATQTGAAALNAPSRLATATAIAPVVAELPRYGIDPSAGYVAWLHPPVSIDLQGFQQTGYANNFQNITAANFVMAADITWHTFDSASGCGFMFRSNGDTNKPSQYVVLISRVASGQMAFLAMAGGKVANYRSFYPKNGDKSFNWFNDATNRLAIVARGNIVDLYTNGQLISELDTTQPPPPAGSISAPPTPELPAGATTAQLQDYNNQLSQLGPGTDSLNGQLGQAQKNFTTSNTILTDGFLGFIGLSQSGTMNCKFENAWLFILVK